MKVADFPSVAAYLDAAPSRSFAEVSADIEAIYASRGMRRMGAFDQLMLDAALTRRSDFLAFQVSVRPCSDSPMILAISLTMCAYVLLNVWLKRRVRIEHERMARLRTITDRR